MNGGCWILDIGWGLLELGDIKGGTTNEQRVVGLADIKGVKEFIDINRSQKILRVVVGIKSILWTLAILGVVYGVMDMGPT